MTTLTITNGDHAADLLAAAGVHGPILPWRDTLYEGRIPPETRLEAVSSVRARHIAAAYGLDAGTVEATFAERDEAMRGHAAHERIEIWLEHDLNDQLQLLQILSFFADEGRSDGIHLIQTSSYLGQERPDTILRHAANAREVGSSDLALARAIFAELGTPTPEPISRRVAVPILPFPFLQHALIRFLEELPSPVSGLGRTETMILDRVGLGRATPNDLFAAMHDSEEAIFMGDWAFFLTLDRLAFCDEPLIEGLPHRYTASAVRPAAAYLRAPLELTAAGEEVATSDVDNIALNPPDRWWAGTHLKGDAIWRWNQREQRLEGPGG